MRRTLNIGLGGTGIKTLLHLRKTLYASGKNPKDVGDKVCYLLIDSHDEDILKINSTLGVLDSTTVDILSFKNDEYIVYNKHLEYTNIKMTRDQMAVGQHGHLKNWLVLESLSNITPGGGTGASQIRNVGRYGFFKTYSDVFNKLYKHLLHLKQGANDADIDVNIICSIAGGTGSGSLLDVILLLNAMKDDPKKGLGRLQINPIIVLPDVFEGVLNKNGQGATSMFRAKATAYAVLSELDTLGVPNKPFIVELLNEKNPITLKENFKVEWMPSSYNNPTIFSSYTVKGTTSLWNMCYLLSSANLPTGTVVNPAKAIGNNNADFKPGPDIANAMFQAISDFIYIKSDDDCVNGNVNPRNFPSEFLLNINNPIGTALTNSSITIGNDTFKFNNLYGSFGISKIYTDNEKLTQVSSLLLLRKYIDFKINAPSTKLPADIINESDVLKGWKIADIVNKLEKTEKGESIYGEIDRLCVVFKNNLDKLIEGEIKPEKVFDDIKDIDLTSRNLSGKNIEEINISDIMTRSFRVLTEKLESEVNLRTQKIHEYSGILSTDIDPTNNDSQGMSFLESLNDFCIKALEKNKWSLAQNCFELIYKDYFITPLKEVSTWSAGWAKKHYKNRDKSAIFTPRMEDLKSIPKNQQGITCKAISETLVNDFKDRCHKEILGQVYQAIELKFLQRIKPYLDPEQTSSFYQIIKKAISFLNDVSNEVSEKVNNGVKSVEQIKETAFSTPIIPDSIDQTFIDRTMMTAIKSKFRNQDNEFNSFSQVENELLDLIHSFPRTSNMAWIKNNLNGKSLGAIFLGLVKNNNTNQKEFFAPVKDDFINVLLHGCYQYLKTTCKLGEESSVSEQFETQFASNLASVQNQVIAKSCILMKTSQEFDNLNPVANTNMGFKYYLSSVDNTDLRNRHAGGGVTSNYRYFSRDANYFVDVKIIVPLVCLDCINDLWPSYKFILNGQNNSDSSQNLIKAEYLHSDFGYFKAFSVPFTPDTITSKLSELKNITCILIEAILLGVINKSNEQIGFAVASGASMNKYYFDNQIKTFGKLLVQIMKGSYENELKNATDFKYKAIKNILGSDKEIQLDIKIELGLKHFKTLVTQNFLQVLRSNNQDGRNVEIEELQKFLLDCVQHLETKYNEKTLNNVDSINAKNKYDELLKAIQTAITLNNDDSTPKKDFITFLETHFKTLSFTDDIYIPVIKG